MVKYDDVRGIAEGVGQQRVLVDGQWLNLRGYSLPDDEVEKLAAIWRETGVFQSPYSRGKRTDHLIAIARLGVNRAWTLGEIKTVLRQVMTDEEHTHKKTKVTKWQRFEKRPRGKRAKDVTERILDNFRALQRLCRKRGVNAYGYRLKQLGCCIDIFSEPRYEEVVLRGGKKKTQRSMIKYIRLNTYSDDPKSLRVRSRESIDQVYPVNFGGVTRGPKEI